MVTLAESPFGDEVVDTAAALLVAGIPVLHGRIFDLGPFVGSDFHDGGVQLVLVAHGRRATFEVAYIAVVVGDDEGALKLSRVGRIDAEIGRQLHGAAHPFGYVHKRPVAEYRRVEGGEEVVAVRNYRAQVLAHKVGVVFHRLADGAEDDAQFGQLLLEGGFHRYAVHDGVDGDAR